MATFTITTDTNIDECTSKDGGDIYNVSAGATLTIDQDSRYGMNASTSASIGRLTTEATTGGTVLVDGRYVRLIPFTGGSGTLTLGTTIDCGSASGEAIGIYTSLTSAPGTTGSSGYLKIKGWNGIAYPTSGEFTKGGLTFTINGADVAGWIEILTDEAGYAQITSGGTLEVRGAWYELGDTNGSPGQTFQIPSNGLYCYVPGIFIEETDGEGDFRFWPAVGAATALATDARAKVCWISSAGVVTLGHNGAGNSGLTPAAGLRVVVPNIITSHCATGTRTANAAPNATLNRRFAATAWDSAAGGRYVFSVCNLTWYARWTNHVSLSFAHTGIADACLVQGQIEPLSMMSSGVGNVSNLDNTALTLRYIRGGTITNSVFCRGGTVYVNDYVVSLLGCDSVSVDTSDAVFLTFRTNSAAATWRWSSCTSCAVSGCASVGGRLLTEYGSATGIYDHHYIDNPAGDTTAAVPSTAITVASAETVIEGLDFAGLTNAHPATSLFTITGPARDVRIRSIGTLGAPLSLGSANATEYAVSIGNSTFPGIVRLDRIYVTNTGRRFADLDASAYDVRISSCSDEYAGTSNVDASELNVRGCAFASSLSAQSNIYGTHFLDWHTSTTAGMIVLLMNQPSSTTGDRVSASAGGLFTSTGTLCLYAEDATATWEDDTFRIGHTGFDGAPVMAGGTASNYLIEYGIDLNDGTGWSEWEEATEANLEANNASIDATLGFKLRVRITTTTANTDAISSLYFATTSTTTTQAYTYKLYETTVTVHAIDASTLGDIAGAVVRLEADAGGEYTEADAIGSGTTDANGECEIVVYHDAAQPIRGVVRRGTTTPFYVQGVLQATIQPGEPVTLTAALTRED